MLVDYCSSRKINAVRWLASCGAIALVASQPALAQVGSSAGTTPANGDTPQTSPTGALPPVSAAPAETAATPDQQAGATSGQGLGDIIVTAQRRSENLQRVPLAITAFTGAALTQNGIHDLSGIATRTPGLTFSPFAPGQNIIALRGVSSNDDGAGTDNSVAVFVDGVYSGRVSNVNPDLVDVQSVEVLRGPQGTLYGKNTIGGAIVINTTLPDTQKTSEMVKIDVGNFGLKSISGVVSGPIGGNWAAKIAFNERYRDGYTHNEFLHTRENDDNTQNVRAQLLYSGDKLHALLSADFNRLHVGDEGRTPLTNISGGLGFNAVAAYQAICGTDGPPTCAANPVKGFSHRLDGGVSLKLDYETSIGTITSISAYRQSHIKWDMDSVGVPQFPLGDLIDDSTKQLSQEVRLSGSAGNFKYVGGLFYLYEHTDRTELFDFGVQGDLANSSQYRQNNKLNSYAAFGQVDWEFIPKLVLTVGGRFTYETKHIDNNSFAGDFPIIETSFTNSVGASWKRFTPKATLAYHPNNVTTLYATVAEGFKSGGFAAAPTTIQDTLPLKQELATNYEAGIKTEVFDNTLRINVAGFYTKYKDLQYQSFGPRPGIQEFGIFRTTNLHKAEAAGAEIEVQWQPTRQLLISGNYAYLYSRYIDAIIPNADFPNQNGQDMIRSPRNKYSINAEYTQPLGERGNLKLSGGYTYTGSQRGELEPYAIQPQFGLVNARLTYTSPGRGVEVALWGQNLANKTYETHVYTVGGEVIGVFGEPRAYGLSLTLRH